MSKDHHHGHSHHAHSHDARDEQSAPWLAPEPLERGAGVGKILFFDAFSGVAGDMTLAAMLDLGVPRQVFTEAIQALGIPGIELRVERVQAGCIGATRVHVVVSEPQPARSYSTIRALLEHSTLDPAIVQLAQAMFLRLGRAEAQVHRVDLERVHFHEVGAVDAIVDIVSAATALNFLGATVQCSPLPMGSGLVNTEHGPVPLPAPATLECLHSVPTVPAGIAGELVTPTGATIVATAAESFTTWPQIAPIRVGWGAGTKRWPDRPNALRLVLGDRNGYQAEVQNFELVEANVDDMTGELAAHALEAMRGAGALDAWVTPLTMKKGRPGMMLSAIAPRGVSEAVVSVMLAETTTIGVRRHRVGRTERPRRSARVSTKYGDISVKISEGDWGPTQVKPEFDEAVKAAATHAVPVRLVLDEVRRVFETLKEG